MERKIYDLLNSVPDHADYAVDAGDLDLEDVPEERINAVRDLLSHTNDDTERFLAAKLLTSWGVHDGLLALEQCMDNYKSIEGSYPHRLRGYDDTYHQILMTVIRYFSNSADSGRAVEARAQVYGPLSKIILLSNYMPFEIANVFDFVDREQFLEYVPLIEQHLVTIIDNPSMHRWKITDAIDFLLKVDEPFVLSLLKDRGKTVADFKGKFSV
ncbi:MAG: hypothetical protein ABIO21_15360 [Pseudomonas sp.]